jgi:Tfp pilus assembly ATPase PilU
VQIADDARTKETLELAQLLRRMVEMNGLGMVVAAQLPPSMDREFRVRLLRCAPSLRKNLAFNT